ncbi:TdeIII family type II restriction endonuclease [Vibrio atlanticus]
MNEKKKDKIVPNTPKQLSLREHIENRLESSIDIYLNNWKKKPTQPLDIIFPEERRVRSIIGGLETSLGTKLWENISKFCAERNEFKVHNEKELKRPEKRPPEIEAVVTKWRNKRETKGQIHSLEGYIKELKEVSKRKCYTFSKAELTSFRSGQGVDIHLEKNQKHYLYDIKTVQINQGDGLKFNSTLMNWYADIICQNPDIEVVCALAFPFNPYVPKTWWQGNGSRAFPLIEKEDAVVEDEFWNFLSGEKHTWKIINRAFQTLGNKNLGKKYKHIFYE